MVGTADLHHQIADTLLPEADAIFHHATALPATVDMLDPEPTLVHENRILRAIRSPAVYA
jgi:hypothetical protein